MKARVTYPHYRLPHRLQLRVGKLNPRRSFDYENMEIDLGWHQVDPGGPAWVPVTPAGSPLMHLEAATEDEAWQNLLEDAAHMPYQGKQGFYERGYRVEQIRS